jgi:hypothetical protein
MCLRCNVDAKLVIEEVIPGCHLYVSQKDDDDWSKGWYGLVRVNDPDFIFFCDFSQSEEKHPELPKGAYDAIDWFYMIPYKGYCFIEACKRAGWNYDNHGHPELWFLARAKKMFQNTK